jgi:hypothetical protein
MRASLAILLFLASAALPAMDTYTWVDENNERHWSDQPHPGADKVELTLQSGYRAPPLQAARNVTRSPATVAGSAYASCAIAQPGADQVYFDVDAVTISVQLAPGRRGGDVISVTVDGSSVAPASTGGTDFTLAPIDRGTHVAAATVRDASGRTLCTAPTVTFHVRQHSVARPR